MVRKPAESGIVLQKQSLFCSLSLTYHSQSVALALLLAKTVLSLWEREQPGSLSCFFSRMNHESSFDGLLHGRGRPPRLPRQGSQGPDLSHLTPEERTIIEGVMQKQQVRGKFTAQLTAMTLCAISGVGKKDHSLDF